MARSCGTIIFFVLFFLNSVGIPTTLYYAYNYYWGLGTVDYESYLRVVYTTAVCKVDAYYEPFACNFSGTVVDKGTASAGLFFTCMALDGIMFIIGMYEMCSSVEVENKNKKKVHIAAGVIYGIMAIFIISALCNECGAVSYYFNHESAYSYTYAYGTGMRYAISALISLVFQCLWYFLLCRWRMKDAQLQNVSHVVAPVTGGAGYVQPAQPVYIQPGQQVYAQQTYVQPGQPVYVAPTQTQYATPAAPEYSKPASDGTAVLA